MCNAYILYLIIFTELPGPPIYFRATQVGPDFAVMEWKSPLSDGGSRILEYTIYKYGITSDVREKIATVTGHEHSYTIRSMQQNLDYYLCIQATNKVGVSPYCDAEYTVTPVRTLGM